MSNEFFSRAFYFWMASKTLLSRGWNVASPIKAISRVLAKFFPRFSDVVGLFAIMHTAFSSTDYRRSCVCAVTYSQQDQPKRAWQELYEWSAWRLSEMSFSRKTCSGLGKTIETKGIVGEKSVICLPRSSLSANPRAGLRDKWRVLQDPSGATFRKTLTKSW